MKPITVKNLVDFRKKSTSVKQTFAKKIQSNNVEKSVDGGGDYWVSCISDVSASFVSNQNDAIHDRIEKIKAKLDKNPSPRTKGMYKRNIDILIGYGRMDKTSYRPTKNLSFIKKSSYDCKIRIKGLEIAVKPSQIYTFGPKETLSMGGIWFVANIKGYTMEELGILCEALYKSMQQNFKRSFNINAEYCIVVDLFSRTSVNYSQLENKEVSRLLTSTIEELKNVL